MNVEASPPLSRIATIVVFAMTALFFSAFAFNASTLGFGIIKGWMWVIVFAGLTIPLNISLLRQPVVIPPVLVWAYGFLAVMFLWTVVAQSPAESIKAIIAYGWYLVTLILTMAMLRTEAARIVAIKAVFVVVVGSTVTNLIMAGQGAYRPSGLYGNPNTSGYALVMGMILTHTFIPQKYRFIYQLFILTGVFVTASRASLLLWAITFVLLYVLGSEKRYYNRWAIATLVILFGIALSPLGSGFLSSLDDPSNEESRLFSLGSKDDLQGDSRVALADLAIEQVQEHPILGQGTGKTTVFYENEDFGTHNMYLTMMMQFGVLGILFIPALAVSLVGRSSAKWQFTVPFVVFLLIASFFDHNLFDQWHYAFVLGMMSSLAGTEFAPATAKQRPERTPATAFAV